jgi:hypothetical protein
MNVTIKLEWGSANGPGSRYFNVGNINDAVTRAAAKVVELDKDPTLSAAFVRLTYTDGQHIFGWTKTSDERPTREGVETAEEAAKGWQHS